LKEALSSAPVLALPDFTKPFHIRTDACGKGVGAVLTQDGHPLAFISKALCPRNQGLSTYEKEYLAILVVVDQWRHYLLQGKFYIHTDQRSLIHLNEQRLHTLWQQKIFTKLLGLDYGIVYKKGCENRVADALSRRIPEDQSLAISMSSPQWLDRVTSAYAQDPTARDLLTKLVVSPSSVPNFSLVNGVIRYKQRVWLGSNKPLQLDVIKALHDSPIGGHSGVSATYYKVKQLFFCTGMKADIYSYIHSCTVCEQAKPDRAKYPGLLQPLLVPSASWEIISMDFVEGLPKSGAANAILVVVDKFSKFSHFIPLRHPFTTATVAKLFMDVVYRYHGMPKSIVSDRDRIFLSKFWQELCSLAGVFLRMSSSYHPQTDGQTERVNHCKETYLRCFVHACPTKWIHWLSLAEFWYNTSFHSTIQRSPFEVLYGFPPCHFGLDASSVSAVPELSDWLEERALMHSLIKQHLLRSQARMKVQADKHRSERSFAVGDWVYLKLQPYVQSSLAPRSNQKLAFKYFGPFRVIARIGSVAYKLELPPSSSVHPVFHVSQLKQSAGPFPVSSTLPANTAAFQVPEAILQRRWTEADQSVEQVLIKWTGMSLALATWENLVALKQRFPDAPSWGHAGSQEEGTVRTTVQEEAQEDKQGCRPKSTRVSRPISRVSGPEWV
jgi:transposase InsO family protein